MDFGDQFQRAIFDRAVVYAAMLWIIAAICAGLFASEIKKRTFWPWVLASLVGGPITWYLLFRSSVYIPPEDRIACRKCGKTIDKNQVRCPYCRTTVDPQRGDRAADVGRQAAAMVFTARRLFGSARSVADRAAQSRRKGGQRRGERPDDTPPPSG